MKPQIGIYFDGGCKPTNPGNKYGSYEVRLNGRTVGTASRIQFGRGTNNEAEFDALASALKWTSEQIGVSGGNPSQYELKMFTDSMILRNRIVGRNRKNKSEPERRMFELTEKCRLIIDIFDSFTIEWRGRNDNVNRFGH